MARDVQVIWVRSEPKYFCKGGWTGVSVICPAGNVSERDGRFASCHLRHSGTCEARTRNDGSYVEGLGITVIGLALIPQDGSASLTQPDSGTTRPGWNERLALFVAGAGFGGFVFCSILHSYLSPANRPISPEPTLGYIYRFKAKYGVVYGTHFEYSAVFYGFWMMWLVGVVSMLWFGSIEPKSRVYPRYPWQVFAAFAISMVLYYVIWQLSIYAARS
jgi:hypothetical protein